MECTDPNCIWETDAWREIWLDPVKRQQMVEEIREWHGDPRCPACGVFDERGALCGECAVRAFGG